ncbi:MAG: hypothetical protein ACLGIA_12975 [Actinomycetes bacterium]
MDAIAALIPPLGGAILCYVIMKSVIGADRNERAALAELDRKERAAAERVAEKAHARGGRGNEPQQQSRGSQA